MRYAQHIRRSTPPRGSTFILVVGILSVLVIIVTTLSFTTQMDVISSSNYSESVQARLAARAGISETLSILGRRRPFTSLTQDWAYFASKESFVGVPLSGRDINDAVQDSDLFWYMNERRNQRLLNTPSLSSLHITDESAKININSVAEADLERALTQILSDAGITETVNGRYLARLITSTRLGKDKKPGTAGVDDDADQASGNIVNDKRDQDFDGRIDNPEEYIASPRYNGIDDNMDGIIDDRYEGAERDGIDNDRDGEIDEPGEGIDEIDEYIADIRVGAFGDDKRWKTLSALRSLPRVSDTVYDTISAYLTVLSSSEETYHIGSSVYTKSNLNTARADEMYEALREYFPDKNEILLQQYVVNIIDFRDPDDIPSLFPGSDAEYPVIGNEITPLITEIYSDSVTDTADGDDGQFVEIYNPYDKSIDVSGWQVVAGISTVTLDGSIAARGYIIITDDYNEGEDPDPEDDELQYGSFYDIFDEVPDGSSKRIIEDTTFDIKDDEGTVYLRDDEGNLIDYQPYENGLYSGVSKSFQRKDLRVRHATLQSPTPFSVDEDNVDETLRLTMEEIVEYMNRPLASPVDVMFISSGFADYENDLYVHHGEPALYITNDTEKLDSRVTDLFTIAPVTERVLTTEALNKINPQRDKDKMRRLHTIKEKLETPSVVGKLNLNTASYYTLLSLPGMTKNFARRIVEQRYRIPESTRRGENDVFVDLTPYRTVSDFLRDDEIWGKDIGERERLWAFYPWANMVTTNSRTFSVVAESKQIDPGQEAQRPHPISIFATLSLDRGNTPVFYFKYLNR